MAIADRGYGFKSNQHQAITGSNDENIYWGQIATCTYQEFVMKQTDL